MDEQLVCIGHWRDLPSHNRAHREQHAGREARGHRGGGGARSVYGGPTSNLGAQQASGRTESMLLMSVTLDVSKLSGWLNADAPLNMLAMVVTPEVFQLEMSALKFVNQ